MRGGAGARMQRGAGPGTGTGVRAGAGSGWVRRAWTVSHMLSLAAATKSTCLSTTACHPGPFSACGSPEVRWLSIACATVMAGNNKEKWSVIPRDTVSEALSSLGNCLSQLTGQRKVMSWEHPCVAWTAGSFLQGPRHPQGTMLPTRTRPRDKQAW